MDTASPAIAAARRRRELLLSRMAVAGGGVAVIQTAPERVRNRDTTFPYRADSYFHYLTGFVEPDAVLVLVAAEAGTTSLLFCRPRDADKEIWDGFRYGPEAACATFGFDEAHPVADLDARLTELLADQPALWYGFGHDPAWDARMATVLTAVRAQARSGHRAPDVMRDVRAELDAMRRVKDADELAIMRRAADIAAAAHCRAMRFCAPGRHEYELEAELLHEFRRHGCEFPAYSPIVAGGANACILHYVANDRPLVDGELVLIDAGGELGGYASDITRTFPVNGRFSGPQRDLYQLVLAAQAAAIDAVKPGLRFIDPHQAALTVLARGMLDLGLLSGTLDEALEKESYKPFYMHRTSHWLGKDVHDAGDYRRGDEWVMFAPGMVLTIEPGCYVRPGPDVPERFWNIGVRIEDDVVVTDSGCEVITSGAPKTVEAIEMLMREGRA